MRGPAVQVLALASLDAIFLNAVASSLLLGKERPCQSCIHMSLRVAQFRDEHGRQSRPFVVSRGKSTPSDCPQEADLSRCSHGDVRQILVNTQALLGVVAGVLILQGQDSSVKPPKQSPTVGSHPVVSAGKRLVQAPGWRDTFHVDSSEGMAEHELSVGVTRVSGHLQVLPRRLGVHLPAQAVPRDVVLRHGLLDESTGLGHLLEVGGRLGHVTFRRHHQLGHSHSRPAVPLASGGLPLLDSHPRVAGDARSVMPTVIHIPQRRQGLRVALGCPGLQQAHDLQRLPVFGCDHILQSAKLRQGRSILVHLGCGSSHQDIHCRGAGRGGQRGRGAAQRGASQAAPELIGVSVGHVGSQVVSVGQLSKGLAVKGRQCVRTSHKITPSQLARQPASLRRPSRRCLVAADPNGHVQLPVLCHHDGPVRVVHQRGVSSSSQKTSQRGAQRAVRSSLDDQLRGAVNIPGDGLIDRVACEPNEVQKRQRPRSIGILTCTQRGDELRHVEGIVCEPCFDGRQQLRKRCPQCNLERYNVQSHDR
mmetsp:Transcript_88834/g.237756  ORF Transcript_88834/g.237756 Transcript_88834/m.237756 type:complete len:534 (-) Transcript_88834:226-1827(-)